MPSDPHITHFDWERGGENGHAISVDIRERLVLDAFTLEENAYRRMAAKNEGFVESEELGYLTLFRFENVSQFRALPSGW